MSDIVESVLFTMFVATLSLILGVWIGSTETVPVGTIRAYCDAGVAERLLCK